MKNILKEVFKVAVLGGALIALQSLAFEPNPGVTPPAGNVPAPVNVGSVSQTKTGGLTVGSLGSLGSAFLATDSGNVGIGKINPASLLDVDGEIRGKLWYTDEYCWGNESGQPSCGTPSPGTKMIHSSKGFCFLTRVVDGANGGPSRVFIGSDGYWYISGGWPYFMHVARCAGMP